MILNSQVIDSKSIISFLDCDRIDTTNLKLIKEQLNPIIMDFNNSSSEESILDFNNIYFIDSSGLSLIINIYKQLNQNNKKLIIINVNEMIFDIFDVTKVNTFIQVSSIKKDL